MTEIHATPRDPDAPLVDALRAGDERAFDALMTRHHAGVLRIARAHVRTQAAAEEVSQEAWMAVVQGVDAFAGRSTFRAWLYQITANVARKRAARDARSVPLSALEPDEGEGPAVSADRFLDAHPRWAGHWSAPPVSWGARPDDRLAARELGAALARAIDALPEAQRTIVVLRDVEGCSSEETCRILGVSEANQRVLLHRARAKLRAALEAWMGENP